MMGVLEIALLAFALMWACSAYSRHARKRRRDRQRRWQELSMSEPEVDGQTDEGADLDVDWREVEVPDSEE